MSRRSPIRRPEVLLVLLMAGYLVLLGWQVRRGTQSALSSLALGAFGPFLSIYDSANRLTREGLQDYFWQRDAAVKAERLEEDNRELQGRLEISQALEKEVLQLRELIKAPKPTGYQVFGARALTEFGVPFGRYLLVSCRSDLSFPDRTPVIGPQGAVGRVQTRIGPLYRILLVTDPSSAVGVMSDRSGVHGVAVGEGRSLSVRWVSNEADVKAGDLFVTSGEDGIFPPGIRMGTVTEVSDGPDYLKRITLSPASRLGDLMWVLLLRKSNA